MRVRKSPLLILSATLAACGASPRLVQQSTTYYEHCQAAEMDPARTVDERRECWVAWLEHYTIGQPLERIGYAQERRIALAHGDEIPPLPDREDPGHELRSSREAVDETPMVENGERLLEADGEAAGTETIVDPDVFRQDEDAPPGRHFSVRSVAPPDQSPIPAPPGASQSPCRTTCNPAWYRCAERCNGRSGSCMNACRSYHRQCMGACNSTGG